MSGNQEDSETVEAADQDAAGATVPVQVAEDEVPLPEGHSVMVGDDGQRYVTMVQDEQTYAIPEADYRAVQKEGGGTLTIQESPASGFATLTAGADAVSTAANSDPAKPQHQVSVPDVKIPPMMMLQPVPPPPGVLRVGTAPRAAKKAAVVPPPPSAPKNFKPIKVDNWGIFLLNRLQSYFQRKEHCDLTIRFPAKNAQIKVHRLVINACTDFFLSMEKEGKLVDCAIDMPDGFTPEAVAPIIRFMYTGRLEVRENMFPMLYTTAAKLQMSVLTKLMDAQINAPVQPKAAGGVKARKRKGVAFEDPLKQIKKIKKIEKKFSDEEKHAKMKAKIQANKRRELEEAFVTKDTVPGKKLPIWKRRSNQPPVSAPPTSSTKVVLTPVAGPPPGASLLLPVGVRKSPGQAGKQPASIGQALTTRSESPELAAAVSSRAYGRSSSPGEKPKIPRKIREIQENLTFEKVRRTGAKNANPPNWSAIVGQEATNTKDMSVEEIKEFMDEQRKRLQQLGEDDDYYDNDAGLEDYADDEPEEEDDEKQVSPSAPKASPPPAKPILKVERKASPRKSVRFSLRPGSISTTSVIDATTATQSSPSKRGLPNSTSTQGVHRVKQQEPVDSSFDAFNQAAEEEGGKELAKTAPGGSGSKNTERKLGSGVAEVDPREPGSPVSSPAKKRVGSAAPPSPTSATDQSQLVQQILKKHPDLFKQGKQVKLKVMTKDTSGKSILQYITLKATASPNLAMATSSNDDNEGRPETALGLRLTPNVSYTGRRGRPKKLKPGEQDPHAVERKEIAKRLKEAAAGRARVLPVEKLATLDQVSKAEQQLGATVDLQTYDPSSEAEALSNVASGIAASLGLAASEQQQAQSPPQQPISLGEIVPESDSTLIVPNMADAPSGPLSDLENFEDNHQSQQAQQQQQQQVLVNFGSESGVGTGDVVVTNGGPDGGQVMQVLQANPDGTALLVQAPPATASQVLAVQQQEQHQQQQQQGSNLEDAMAKLHGSSKTGSSIRNTGKNDGEETKVEAESQNRQKGISQIAQDWEDDEEEA